MLQRGLRLIGAWFLLGVLGGCAGLRLEHVDTAQKSPNNVWVFFTVQQEGRPVAGLTAEDFEIYEDGKLVAPAESKQVAQDPDRASVSATVVLLDASNVADASRTDAMVEAARALVDRVGKTQQVAVYAFDGSEKLHPIAPFTESEGRLEGGLDGVHKFVAKDPSTNLYGAVVEGALALERFLDRDARPIKLGTVVVFSSGADRAARVSREAMSEVLGGERHRRFRFYAVGLSGAAAEAHLQDVGRDGTEVAPDVAALGAASERVAERIEGQRKRLYLLSYCTPARRGEHDLRIQARTKGDKPSVGSLRTTFVADGFGPPPECDPNVAPAFVVTSEPEVSREPAPNLDQGEQDKQKRKDPPTGKPAARTGAKPTVIDYKPETPK